MEGKLKLYGFNNLTKSLSFNIYDVCYAKSAREQKDYIAYIDEQYNSERLTKILFHVTEMIGAHVLNVSKQDYEPQGASVTFLIAEDNMIPTGCDSAASAAMAFEDTLHLSNHNDEIVAHLDKSHITVHTYPEYHPETNIATFRVDIDVATCGEITVYDIFYAEIPYPLLGDMAQYAASVVNITISIKLRTILTFRFNLW